MAGGGVNAYRWNQIRCGVDILDESTRASRERVSRRRQGCEELDENAVGVTLGDLVHVRGSSVAGKTTLLLHIAAQCLLPREFGGNEKRVVWISASKAPETHMLVAFLLSGLGVSPHDHVSILAVAHGRAQRNSLSKTQLAVYQRLECILDGMIHIPVSSTASLIAAIGSNHDWLVSRDNGNSTNRACALILDDFDTWLPLDGFPSSRQDQSESLDLLLFDDPSQPKCRMFLRECVPHDSESPENTLTALVAVVRDAVRSLRVVVFASSCSATAESTLQDGSAKSQMLGPLQVQHQDEHEHLTGQQPHDLASKVSTRLDLERAMRRQRGTSFEWRNLVTHSILLFISNDRTYIALAPPSSDEWNSDAALSSASMDSLTLHSSTLACSPTATLTFNRLTHR